MRFLNILKFPMMRIPLQAPINILQYIEQKNQGSNLYFAISETRVNIIKIEASYLQGYSVFLVSVF